MERQRTRADIPKGELVKEEHRLYLHYILDTEKARLDTVILMGDIQKVKELLQNGVDKSLLTKAEGRIAERFLIIKKVRGHLSVAMNDKAIQKEIQYYGYFALISNEKMDAFSALREYQLREKTEEGFVPPG